MPGRSAVRPVPRPHPDTYVTWSTPFEDRAPTSATETCPHCGTAIRPGDEKNCPSELVRKAAEALIDRRTDERT